MTDRISPPLDKMLMLSHIVSSQNITSPVPMNHILKQRQTYNSNCSIMHQNTSKIRNHNRNMSNGTQDDLISDFVHISDRTVPPRAVAVLPSILLLLKGVVLARKQIPPRIRFGPVQGVNQLMHPVEAMELSKEAAEVSKPIFLLKRNVDSVVHVNVYDKDKSNWFSLLRLGTKDNANVWLYEVDDQLYGITTQIIEAHTPLALGYSKTYSDRHMLPPGQPTLDLTQELSSNVTVQRKKWWCYECHISVKSAFLLQRHMDYYHKDEGSSTRCIRRHRCKHCSRTFARLFTLRRHIKWHCHEKHERNKEDTNDNSNNVSQSQVTDVSLNTSNYEDSKTPSDESLPNYTKMINLDFSTNLFDTDRIPNLDISGSSRSETDFNPFSNSYKEDNTDLILKCDQYSENSDTHCINKNKTAIDKLVKCPYCKVAIKLSLRRQHLNECQERRYQCDCGRAYVNKQMLEQHVYLNHQPEVKKGLSSNGAVSFDCEPTVEEKTNEETDASFSCEPCSRTFKRRGMYVNHLWRVHSVRAATPVTRPVRLYPCGHCHKLYRSARKRDLHVDKHHPDGRCVRARTISGGSRTTSAAACPACPRQYCTRAKLLQHLRNHHPHIAPATKAKLSNRQQ